MRVLLLAQWYIPEPDIKIHLLAKDLVARGHQVTSITGFPNYPQGRIYPGYHQRLRQWEDMDGVRVLRLPLYPDHSRSGVKRIINYLSFATSASVLGPLLCGPADVMWVYHPPLTVGIPAWLIGLLRRVPFVYEVQDMWPETLTVTGMMPSRRVARWVSRLARFVYRRAAAITVISPGFKRNLVDKGVPPEKIHVIPNWADEDVYHPVLRDETLAAEHGLAGRFNVVYGGNMGAAQGLQNVIDAATLLRDSPDVQFVLIGDGVDQDVLRQMVQERELDNVCFLGRQPMKDMPRFFALADALLVHLKRDPLFEITIPGKTIAYLACGRPILGVVSGDPADVIRQAGAGVICPQENPATLARTVRELYAMPVEQREAMGQAGRRAFLANYTRQVLVDRYAELLEKIAKQNRR
ncbi:glycosyltransferase WbuB [Candidatus Woesearchaeota archaeon]|nr:MAG: glycosyltransferase WbuB [Candidatus Woesearchaeota archaeon]